MPGKTLKHIFMLSRLTIEMDFDNATPFIKIQCNHNSPDLRDRAVNVFFEKLQQTSRWATIAFVSAYNEIGSEGNVSSSIWRITPLKPSELRDEAKLMLAMADHIDSKS
jgi:hypothetical protein